MTNINGIESAYGMSREDSAALSDLLDVYESVASRNVLLNEYYDSAHLPPSIGIDNIPENVDPGVRCDWARKAVTSVSERVRMDGFVFEGDYEDEAISRVLAANDLNGAFNRHVASELTHGCMFATVQRTGGSTSVRMHTAETSAAIWDTAAGRIGSGFVIADTAKFDWSPHPVPSQVNLHLPGRVVVLRRTGPVHWAAETLGTPLDRPMMEAFAYCATGTKPFGETRITPTVRYLVDEVERTLRYMAVSSAIYAVPMIAALGLTDEQFDAMAESKWLLRVGSWFLSTRDEDGNHPDLQQFSGASPQPYIEAIQTYAKLFSGATGVPLNSLGIVQDNPSSAEAIDAQREDICTAAEDCIESNRVSMRNVALMAMAVEGNTTVEGLTDEQKTVMPHFKNPRTPSLASTADAMVKIAGVLEGFSQTREFLTGMGFEAAEVESIRSQLDAAANRRALAQIMQGGPVSSSTPPQPAEG